MLALETFYKTVNTISVPSSLTIIKQNNISHELYNFRAKMDDEGSDYLLRAQDLKAIFTAKYKFSIFDH